MKEPFAKNSSTLETVQQQFEAWRTSRSKWKIMQNKVTTIFDILPFGYLQRSAKKQKWNI
jgi:hypothetical protein